MKSILFGFSFLNTEVCPGRHSLEIPREAVRPKAEVSKRPDHTTIEAPSVRPRATRPKKKTDVLSRILLISLIVTPLPRLCTIRGIYDTSRTWERRSLSQVDIPAILKAAPTPKPMRPSLGSMGPESFATTVNANEASAITSVPCR